MPGLFTEDTYEQAIIELFENMGYDHIYAPDFDRDYTSPLMDSVLRDSLVRVNRGLPVDAIEEAINKLRTFDTGSLLQKNMTFMDYLQNGITVKFFVNGEEQATIVKLVDYEKIDNNTFYVVNQYTFVENGNNRRPDIILFINGMPLVLMELKSPSKDEVGVENAYKQIRNYIKDIPSLFYYNAICVISDLSSNKAGTITSGLDRFMDWKCKDGSKEESGFAEFETFYEGMFQKKRLLDILKNFILFSGTGTGRFKVLAGYHQYFAVRKAIERAKIATRTDGKGGVFWHTQGSGKSLSMVFYAHLLQEALDSPTIVVMTDRIDLDDQLYAQFSQCADFLRQTPVQAESKEHLKSLLDGRSANGIIFTTMFKFERGEKPLSERRNIVVMADEAHRGQYGFEEKIVVSENQAGEKEAHTVVGNARVIHDALPNATFIGFTGTPIFTENAVDGHTTKEVFGNCLHRYLIKDAIADENVLGFLVEYYHGSEEVQNGSTNRMTEIAQFILNNFNKSTFDGEFDALFAVQSVPMLIRYYKIFKELNPKIRIGAVFTYAANGSQDDELTGMGTGSYLNDSAGEVDELQAIMDDYNEMFGTSFTTENFRAYYDDINLRMKKKRADMKPLDLCLVVGMFLTGFDSKKLNTLYVDKNMEYHGLLQAFSRTNRVLNEKKRFGKIVCFRDLKSNVDAAIKLFSNSNNPEEIVRPPFEEIKQEYKELASDFLKKYPDTNCIDLLQSETAKKEFVLAFRDIIRKHAEIQIYEDYSEEADDLGMTEQQFMDFRSKYLDIHDTFALVDPAPSPKPDDDTDVPDDGDFGDVDFCLELLHSDIINVAYILELIAELDPYSADYAERRQNIIDTMIKDAEMRSKAKLIDGFIQKNVDDDKENFMIQRDKADGTSDLEERLNHYIAVERENAVNSLAEEEEISSSVLNHFLKEYDYLQKEQPEIIQKALKEKHLGLIKTRKALTRILDRLRNIIRTFSWD